MPIGPELRKLTASALRRPRPHPLERRRQLAQNSPSPPVWDDRCGSQGLRHHRGATALQIAARSVAEKLGIPYVFVGYCPAVFPSPHHAPPPLPPLPGQAPVPATADNRELWARDGERFNDLFGPGLNSRRAALGLSPVTDARSHVFTDRPWLAADPALAPWPDPGDHSVLQTGAWIVPDERPLSRELEAFLDAGEPPVYFGFGSMRAPQDVSQVIINTARELGRRAIVSRGWGDLSPVDSQSDCLAIDEVNQQALFKRVAAVCIRQRRYHNRAASRRTPDRDSQL
jgi:vancomycin aglycone glucosyltransferase